MLTLETFKQDWDKQFPDVKLHTNHFLLAVSGGVDSIVLAHIMKTLNVECTIAHVNFQLRGAESERDEQFVRDFAICHQIPIQVNKVDTNKYASAYKLGIQEAAREIRYAWFGALIEQLSSPHKQVILLTAHHANDQVETILMHLFRGTGIHGLTGIPMRRNDVLNIARPLLNFSKEEIASYAKTNALSYVEDSSNQKDDYSRNFIRNTLMPQVQKIYNNANDNIIATAQRLKEAEEIVNKTVDAYWQKGLVKRKGILSIAIKYWNKVKDNKTYTWGLIKLYGFKPQQLDEVIKILDANQGAYITSSTHQFTKWVDQIQITLLADSTQHLVIDKTVLEAKALNEKYITTQYGKLSFEIIESMDMANISKAPNIVYLDANKIEWPLLLRTWASTDYFYPFGLGKKKKLNHFLSDLKLSPGLKKQVAVLTAANRILWVIGKRMDDRFKLTSNTTICLKINWEELA